jgi:hypothetical protein
VPPHTDSSHKVTSIMEAVRYTELCSGIQEQLEVCECRLLILEVRLGGGWLFSYISCVCMCMCVYICMYVYVYVYVCVCVCVCVLIGWQYLPRVHTRAIGRVQFYCEKLEKRAR